jgi:hypothetical protein
MKKRGRIELVWEGDATVEAARKAMKRGDAIEIGLPLGVHHALFRHLHPESAPGLPEDLDELAGPEILRRISTVAGLEEIAKLEKPAKAARYRVQLLTPDPLLVLLPPARKAS